MHPITNEIREFWSCWSFQPSIPHEQGILTCLRLRSVHPLNADFCSPVCIAPYQLRDTALTGKPVVVVQYPTSRHDIEDMRPDDNRVVEGSASSIIAVSYEARPSGVRLITKQEVVM